MKEKEIIEIADDSSDDGDFQSTPNNPVMADSLPEPKAASPKKNKERSVPIDPEKEALTYPFNGKQAITIKESDIQRVENNKFLNDTVIDAYPKML
ncbi:hypothetical protein K501DRAFT_309252 [Backusella circina FSU 941]|nr:hypothetical protein K501DRAFT_309252 [Backusella circina FSU 941]